MRNVSLALLILLGAAAAVSGAPDEPARDLHARVVSLYDAQFLGPGREIVRLMRHREWEIRAIAARAAGRIGDPAARVALESVALRDRVSMVRLQAVFALGELGDPRSRRILTRLLRDDDPFLRELAAESLAKIGARQALPELRAALTREVGRLETWQRPGWPGRPRQDVSLIETPFLDVGDLPAEEIRPLVRILLTAWRLEPEGWEEDVVPLLTSRDAHLRAAAAYFLSRRPAPEAVAALAAVVEEDPCPLARAWAARALGRTGTPGTAAPLLTALEDPDPGVVVEALRGLARKEEAADHPWLLAVGGHASLHVRLALFATLGALGGQASEELLEAALEDPRPGVRGVALRALARADAARAMTYLQSLGAMEPAWQVRAAAADGLGLAGTEEAARILELGMTDPDPRVVWHALAALGSIEEQGECAAGWARRLLGSDDVVVRAVAASVLGEHGSSEDLPRLAGAFREALAAPGMEDAALSALDAAVALGKGQEELVNALLGEGIDAKDPVLKRRAAGLLEERTGEPTRHRVYPLDTGLAPEQYEVLVQPRTLPRRARIYTDGGEFEMVLFRHSEPLTVLNFTRLAEQGKYQGVTFHRIVPNFVVQGGDPRGDGWGGPGWSIRDEIDVLRYGTGAVGMALSGPDTGGSQWFVTLSPQPHLDGGYTIFGQVVEGMDVLWEMPPDAKIVEVELFP
jgi:cyclophilin family peptidyl-prolyl cis-trans isomerase/HEAT repeat protein